MLAARRSVVVFSAQISLASPGCTLTTEIVAINTGYKLFLPGCSSTARHNTFSYCVAKMWKDLPADNTDVPSRSSSKRSLTAKC